MSACVSSHGEYSEHALNAAGECQWCGAFDAESVRRAALAQIDPDAIARKHGVAWIGGGAGAEVIGCTCGHRSTTQEADLFLSSHVRHVAEIAKSSALTTEASS